MLIPNTKDLAEMFLLIGERARHYRGVQIRADAVDIYVIWRYTCSIIVAHATYT